MDDTPVDVPLQAKPSSEAWPRWTRIAFRFAFLYWVLYMLPTPGAVSLAELLPWGGNYVYMALSWPLISLSPWVGKHVFHLTGQGANWHPTGSGDAAMNYVLAAIVLALAVAGSALWSIISEPRARRSEYRTAYAWLRLFLRFTLAVTLLTYGFIKIFPGQFGPLGLYGLTETYGDSTPMHLLWTFMGQSRPYTIFAGLMEAIPGALLLFRRTTTVGLLMSAGVMLNVMMMNFCYDVPVKLYSTQLLLISLFLLLPDALPLWRFLFVRREAVLAGVWLPRWERKPLRIGAHILQGLVVLAALVGIGWGTFQWTHGIVKVASPLQGVYAVDAATGFGANMKWVKIVLDNQYFIAAGPDAKPTFIQATYDLKTQTMNMANPKASLHWTRDAAGALTLAGTFNNAPASMTLHKTSPDTFQLNARGFHWISEQAYNH
jgi:hypothetical protein